MEILIISGFLGAGKTTFIQEMAKKTGRKFVIVENEFAELGVDGPLLAAQNKNADAPELEITEISEGCICCSTNLDFADSVLTIANTIAPDYLLVEPSGVAMPSNILKNLKRICYEQIGLLAPITIVDGQHYHASREKYPTYFDDQISHARHLVISKSEVFSEADFLTVAEDLGVPDDVHFPTQHYTTWTPEDFFVLLDERLVFDGDDDGVPLYHYEKKEKVDVKEEALETLAFSPFSLTNPVACMAMIENLIGGRYGNIARAKGYGTDGTHWFRFDVVEGDYVIGGCEPMEDTRAVVIGSHLRKKALEALMQGQALTWEGEQKAKKQHALLKRALKKKKKNPSI